MADFRRSVWAILLLIGVLAPFAAVFLLMRAYPLPHTASAMAADAASAATAPATAPATLPPILAAGDGQILWVARPSVVNDHPAHNMLRYTVAPQMWEAAPRGGGFFGGFPVAMAAVAAGADDAPNGAADVFYADGSVCQFTLQAPVLLDRLPDGHTLLGVTATGHGAFALTRGIPISPATHPTAAVGDASAPASPITQPGAASFHPASSESATVATTQAATETAAVTTAKTGAAAHEPATTASRPAIPARQMINALWLRGSNWVALPPLGDPGTADAPAADAHVALAHTGNRLIALWVNPSKPSLLVARSLAPAAASPRWSAPVHSRLAQPLPAGAPLLTVTLDSAPYVFWPLRDGKSVAIVGGRLLTTGAAALTLPPAAQLPPLLLGSAANGLDPNVDVAVGAVGNSIAVMLAQPNAVTSAMVFSQYGRRMMAATPVKLATNRQDLQVSENFAMLIILLLLALSFWRWPKQPPLANIPPALTLAPLPLRGGAFLIDLAIPFIIVVTAMGLWENGGYQGILAAWAATMADPYVIVSSVPLMLTLGAYTLHVAIGEMFFRRSIGKAVLGLQVLMVDGSAPTVAAVIVRNLVRLVEIIPGILIFFIFISKQRQRLGDLMAHTIVVANKSPDAPEAAPSGETKKPTETRDEEPVERT